MLFAMLDGTMAFTEHAEMHAGRLQHQDLDLACFEGLACWEYQLPATFPPEAADLVRKTLQPRRSRIDAAEVECHEWMREPSFAGRA